MLKHRYNSLSESISDFDRMLDGMNGVQPLERRVDEDLLDLFRDEQAIVRLEQQIEHVHRAIYGSGMPISEAESESIRTMHAHAAAMYNETADKAMARIVARRQELAGVANDVRTASLKRMQDFHDKLRRKAGEHGALAKPTSSEKKVVNDSVNESVKPRAASGLAVYRRLAGIDEVVQMPRDPGLLGTTRFNASYDEMAKPFDEWAAGARAVEKGLQAVGKGARAVYKKAIKPVATVAGGVVGAVAKGAKDAAKGAVTGAVGGIGPGVKKGLQVGKALAAESEAEDLSIEGRIAALREGRSKDQQAAGLKKTTRAALAHGDSDFFTLKKSGEARRDIKARGGDPDIHDVNKHMAREIVKKVTPWDPLAKGNKESPQKRLADVRLGRSGKR